MSGAGGREGKVSKLPTPCSGNASGHLSGTFLSQASVSGKSHLQTSKANTSLVPKGQGLPFMSIFLSPSPGLSIFLESLLSPPHLPSLRMKAPDRDRDQLHLHTRRAFGGCHQKALRNVCSGNDRILKLMNKHAVLLPIG